MVVLEPVPPAPDALHALQLLEPVQAVSLASASITLPRPVLSVQLEPTQLVELQPVPPAI
jgi:hypothetical protein